MSRTMQRFCIGYGKMLAFGVVGLTLVGCGAGLLPVLTGTGGFIAGAANSSEDGADGQDGADGIDGVDGVDGDPGETTIIVIHEPSDDVEVPVTGDVDPLSDKPGLGLGRDNPNSNGGEGNPDHGKNEDEHGKPDRG